MKVKKIILIILLLATILLLACVTFYKFINTNNEEQKGEVKEDFISGNVSEIVKNPITSDLDKDKYAENIIKEAKKATEYNYFDNKESITGQIYIGDDKYLYITDTNKNSTHRVSTIKFKTMYVKEFNYTNGIYIALISEDNKIYCMELAGNDISKAIVVPAHTSIKEVTNFTNVNIKTDMFGDSTTMFVLSGDGNIYDVASGIRYNENIISLYNRLYAFENATMTNVFGEQLQDKNKQNYKIKYIFFVEEKDNKFMGNNKMIVITQDNKLVLMDNDVYNIYEYDKKVKDIKFDKKLPYTEGNLEIVFEDDYKVNLKASSNEYFSLNKFEPNLGELNN